MRISIMLVAATALIVTSIPARAHEGSGAITVVTANLVAPDAVRYRIRLTTISDGHPAKDATVTVVAEHPSGARVGPQPLLATAEEGVYEATVAFPEAGAWVVRFTSVTPPATAEQSQAITAVTTTAPSRTTTTEASPPATAGAGTPVAIWIAVGVIVAGGAWILRRRPPRARSDG